MTQSAHLPENSLVSELSHTLAAANRYLALLLHRAGLADLVPSHGDILMCLFAHEPLTMQTISERIDRDPSTVTVLVKKLKDAGYVETSKDERDRRRTEVKLTARGRALRTDFDEISRKLSETQMRGVSSDDLAAVRSTLARMKDNFVYAYQQESEEGERA